ncbi:Two component system sensor protein [Desulfosarcina cetonica]|uniref:cache domain-containing protein n=1 Tax=Desulfosarcina cetonica TaxID=90730 RepID=UPI0006CFC462|nr:cache domain-containing protein [Desulfosarcina cetonica]VTR69369.1 Two component system sensor protein [Desulfosarcina cetonica]
MKQVSHMLGQIPIRIFLPVVLTVLLFILTIFLLILPEMKERLLEGKREVIRELVASAWSSLDDFARQEQEGHLTRREAQQQAIHHIRGLRYGYDQKDYFWINDMQPRMIMHPYRPDLEGKDISNFTDPSGKRLFVDFVNTVRNNGAGYVDYQWQWMDDPTRIVPKISYVKGFAPWGWIIGTGIYVGDVHAQISAITRKTTFICLWILLLIILLSVHIVWHGIKVTGEKRQAEEMARVKQEQLFQAAKMVSLGTLVSGVAHEINNPITSILLNAPNLGRTWEAIIPILDAHQQQHGDFQVGAARFSRIRDRIPQMLTGITDDARRVRNIVADLKDFSRDNPSAMKDQVDLNDVIKKAVVLTTNLIKKSTRNFSVDYQSGLPVFRGNAQRVEQVVINLVVNACQALPDRDRAIAITTRSTAGNDRVVFCIRDEGVGIDGTVLKQITDPFFTTRREAGGTGLGLAISDRIVRDHGGEMIFESVPETGTTVSVFFPLAGRRSVEATNGDRK